MKWWPNLILNFPWKDWGKPSKHHFTLRNEFWIPGLLNGILIPASVMRFYFEIFGMLNARSRRLP
jgi:hypothetical protein